MMNTNLIIGKTGSLKTTGILFKEVDKIIDEGESLIILDKKEEYYKTFKEKLDKSGYKSLVFNLNGKPAIFLANLILVLLATSLSLLLCKYQFMFYLLSIIIYCLFHFS